MQGGAAGGAGTGGGGDGVGDGGGDGGDGGKGSGEDGGTPKSLQISQPSGSGRFKELHAWYERYSPDPK